jgi:hypothetical protein
MYRDPSPGQYILTGSSVPRDEEIKHSGAGRFAKVVMRPTTLFESGESTGQVALSNLLVSAEIAGEGLEDLGDLAAATCCTFGLLFESLCVRDLRVYAQATGGGVFHYRDARNLECDAIIEWPDGRWGAVEIKLDVRHEDDAAATLLKIQRLVRSQHGGPPSFLAVITGRGHAYRRPDCVYTLPITTLRP